MNLMGGGARTHPHQAHLESVASYLICADVRIPRDVKGGRNLETPGESAYLSGEYATAFIRGLQNSEADPGHWAAGATCKHYVANSMEHTTEVGVTHDRAEFNASVPMQDLVGEYMVPFQACVEKGASSGLMCSYNAVNGVPSCANPWLLNQVARAEWGGDPIYVTSDCGADADVYNPHHFAATPEQAAADILKAGQDINCGGFEAANLPAALDKGLATPADLDRSLANSLSVRMRLGHFDPPGPLQRIGMGVVCSAGATELARDGAAQGVVLLKNSGCASGAPFLPLDPATAGTVAVIGPHASGLYGRSISYYYFGVSGCMPVCGTNATHQGPFWTIADAVAAHATRTVVQSGVPDCSSNDTSAIAAAVAVAAAADTVVLALGTDLTIAAEGKDAVNLTLSPAQQQLATAVLAVAKRGVLVALTTAVPLDVSDLVADARVGGIVHLGVPGIQAIGVGDVLFGKKSVAGRLVQTWYPREFQNQISIFDMSLRPGISLFPRPDCPQRPAAACPRAANPGVTYKYYTGRAVFPFGFGLSYTSFSYKVAAVPPSGAISLDPLRDAIEQTWRSNRTFIAKALLEPLAGAVPYSVNVTNTGTVDSDDVVLGFLVPPGAGTGGVPLQQLFGFERVHVPAGETVTVSLYPELLEFSQVGVDGQRAVLPGRYTVRFGLERGSAIADADAGGTGGFAEHSLHAA